MPKITKLCLHLLKLLRDNCGLSFSIYGVYLIVQALHTRFCVVFAVHCQIIQCVTVI